MRTHSVWACCRACCFCVLSGLPDPHLAPCLASLLHHGACSQHTHICAFGRKLTLACLQGQLEGRGAAQRGWPLRGSLMVSVPDDGLTQRPSMTTVDRDRGVSVVIGLATLPLSLLYHEPL